MIGSLRGKLLSREAPLAVIDCGGVGYEIETPMSTFLELPLVGEDVFLHIEVLRRSGLADLQPGEAVSLRVVDGKRGRMAMQVTSWEAAMKADE